MNENIFIATEGDSSRWVSLEDYNELKQKYLISELALDEQMKMNSKMHASIAARDAALEAAREALENLLSRHGFYYSGEDEMRCECKECQKAAAALAALEEMK